MLAFNLEMKIVFEQIDRTMFYGSQLGRWLVNWNISSKQTRSNVTLSELSNKWKKRRKRSNKSNVHNMWTFSNAINIHSWMGKHQCVVFILKAMNILNPQCFALVRVFRFKQQCFIQHVTFAMKCAISCIVCSPHSTHILRMTLHSQMVNEPFKYSRYVCACAVHMSVFRWIKLSENKTWSFDAVLLYELMWLGSFFKCGSLLKS